jgi:hypothetical protein
LRWYFLYQVKAIALKEQLETWVEAEEQRLLRKMVKNQDFLRAEAGAEGCQEV